MAKFTLFLIHGIGVHKDPAWADPVIKQLQHVWDKDISLQGDLEDYVEIVPLQYDSVFESYLDEFSDVSKAVFSDALNLDDEVRQSIAADLESENVSQRNFVWSYICDVLLYKMSLVKEQVNAHVADQIYQRLAQGSTSDEFGIVAHSLGTRVITDTLQNVVSGKATESNFYKQGYRIKFLMQLSDVTDLFGLPLYHDPFPPEKVFSPDTFDYFRTVSNRFDPIASMVPPRLSNWPEGRAEEILMGRPLYKNIVLDHVHQTNVHGFTHYLLHPEVSHELLDLCGFKPFLREPFLCEAGFPNLGPDITPELRSALACIIDDAAALSQATWQTYINVVLKFGNFTAQHGSNIRQEIVS